MVPACVQRLAIFVLLTLAVDARAAEPVPAEPVAPAAAAAQSAPTRVRIGLFATSIPEVDIKSGTFTVDMYVWVVYAGSGPFDVFEIANGEIISKVEQDRVVEGDVTYVEWRVKATMHTPLSLADYPFDHQVLAIQFEHPALESRSLVYEPDAQSYRRSGVEVGRWGVREDLEIPEYEITRSDWQVVDWAYATDFGNPFNPSTRAVYSRAIFEVAVARSFLPYCYKIIIPLMVIIAIAYLVFFLPPIEIQSASGLAMTSLLTCVALNLTVSSNLPEIGYLIASDKFFICTYLLIFVTLAETVWTHALALRGQEARALAIEKRFRVIFPIAFVLSFVATTLSAVV